MAGAVNTAEAPLGRPLLVDLTDEAIGETAPPVIVSDNGPAMKSTAMARWFAARSSSDIPGLPSFAITNLLVFQPGVALTG